MSKPSGRVDIIVVMISIEIERVQGTSVTIAESAVLYISGVVRRQNDKMCSTSSWYQSCIKGSDHRTMLSTVG